MKRVAKGITVALVLLFIPTQGASAENPFPGVAYGAEVPGYTVSVPCQGSDCGIGIIPWFACPAGSASDGADGYTTGVVKRFCRNSWSPPTSAADEEDFRNRQQLAVAAATLESQAYSAANPGEQKCITWGPIVHANGISTASGGVCANVVGTKPDGSTVAVAPSRVGSGSSGQTTSGTPSTDSSTASSRPTSSGAQTLIPFIDLTQYGFGRPFTQVVAGNLAASQCASGFQAATNSINTGFSEYPATECWPDNAWAAYSIGGNVWTQFKNSNGAIDAQAEAARRVQVNAIRALALQQAQLLASQTIGVKRCNTWDGFEESGQECAYIPIQNNSLGRMTSTSSGDTSTSVLRKTIEVVVATISSKPGQTQTEWENSTTYKSFTCPSGSGRAIAIDLKGTASNVDDIWSVNCVQIQNDPSVVSDSSTVQISDSATVVSLSRFPSTSNETSTAAITSDALDFKGSIKQISDLVQALDLSISEDAAIASVTSKLMNMKNTSKLVKLALPTSPDLRETAKSLTPLVCKVSGLVIQPKKAGTCQISYTFEGESGNSFETIKKVAFKK